MKKIYLLCAAALIGLTLNSCVKDGLYGPSSISKIQSSLSFTNAAGGTRTPAPVTVSAKIVSLVGMKSATLYYTVGNVETGVEMVANENIFTGVIPAQPIDTDVSYYIKALSNNDDVTISPTDEYTSGYAPVDYNGLILNELNGNDKFIELYNGSDHEIPLYKVTIKKDGDVNWTGNSTQTIAKGGYLLLYSVDVAGDHADYDASLFFDSGLSAKKAVRVEICNPKGADLDDFNLKTHPTGSNVPGSYGRNADGVWYIQGTITPGGKNTDGQTILTGLEVAE